MTIRAEDPDDLLGRVRGPAQYLGCEQNVVRKDPAGLTGRLALAYPDLYAIAMSYLGLQVLYDAVNRQPDLWAERVCAPDLDMQAAMHRSGMRLCTLESRTPLDRMDLIGFSLQHELNLPDVLAMLRMAGIPLRAADRTAHHPLVIAGGPCASNPEPLAPALDAVVLGDGEDVLVEMVREVGRARRLGATRTQLLDRLQEMPGVYLPSRYQVSYDPAGKLREVTPVGGAPARVRRRLVDDLDRIEPPSRPLVPCAPTIHERLAIEIQRGCTRGCRFCQAGMINRPVRQRGTRRVLQAARRGLARTGWDQVSLLSLSAGDHPGILTMLERFYREHAHRRISVSLPSLRAETLTPALAELVKTVRKSGFTIAPEAGSERLRAVINKQLDRNDIIAAARGAFGAGWRLIKLYFMVGLPTEREEDHDAIVELVEDIKKALPRGARINVGISTFVPKPHTPFQWEAMVSPEQAGRIHRRLRRDLEALGGVKVGWSPAWMSWAEGVLARGDRRMFDCLVRLVDAGQRLAGWSEHFDPDRFRCAFDLPGEYPLATRDPAFPLPWEHLDLGPSIDFLRQERARALQAAPTGDCSREGCTDCGACQPEGYVPVLATVPAPDEPPVPEPAPAPGPAGTKRLRLTMSKTGPAIHLGHLEFMKSVVRAMRRAGWPLVYTAGFHPKPRLSFGPACPVGVESRAELLDIHLARCATPDDLLTSLRPELPPGVTAGGARWLEPDEPGVMQAARAVRYHLRPQAPVDPARVATGVQALLARRSWTITRRVKGKTRTVEVRPALLSCRTAGPERGAETICELAVGAGSAARPADVARAIYGTEAARVVREALLLEPGAEGRGS